MDELDGTRMERMRPLQMGEMLSRIWDLLRGNVALYLKLTAVPAAGFLLLYAAMLWPMHEAGMFPPPPRGTPPDPAKAWMFVAAIAIMVPLALFILAIYMGAACWSALATMRGERATCRSAYQSAGRRAPSLIWMMVIRCVTVLFPWIALIALLFGGAIALGKSGPHPGAYYVLWPVVVLTWIGEMVWAIWIGLHWSLGDPACMAEDLTGWKALKRSGQLSRGGKWRIFGVMFLVYLIGAAAVIALELVGIGIVAIGALALSLMHIHFNRAPALSLEVPLFLLFIAAFYVVVALQYAGFSVALTVLYQDQRFRHEGSLALPLGS